MKIIRLIEALLVSARQYLCGHRDVTAFPGKDHKVLLMCQSCGKMAVIEHTGKYWCADDLADKYLKN